MSWLWKANGCSIVSTCLAQCVLKNCPHCIKTNQSCLLKVAGRLERQRAPMAQQGARHAIGNGLRRGTSASRWATPGEAEAAVGADARRGRLQEDHILCAGGPGRALSAPCGITPCARRRLWSAGCASRSSLSQEACALPCARDSAAPLLRPPRSGLGPSCKPWHVGQHQRQVLRLDGRVPRPHSTLAATALGSLSDARDV